MLLIANAAQKEAELKAELEREVKKAGGTGKKSKRITDLEKMIGEMNDEFKAKETQMSGGCSASGSSVPLLPSDSLLSTHIAPDASHGLWQSSLG